MPGSVFEEGAGSSEGAAARAAEPGPGHTVGQLQETGQGPRWPGARGEVGTVTRRSVRVVGKVTKHDVRGAALATAVPTSDWRRDRGGDESTFAHAELPVGHLGRGPHTPGVREPATWRQGPGDAQGSHGDWP